MTDPDSGTWVYGYDGVGNLIYQEGPQPLQHTEYCYDALNRLLYKTSYANDDYTSTRCTPMPTSQQDQYLYDQGTYGIGRLTRVDDSSGSTAFAYDIRGRTIGTALPAPVLHLHAPRPAHGGAGSRFQHRRAERFRGLQL
jgi:YD repeat-containing protein